jgi:hypothetical protein
MLKIISTMIIHPLSLFLFISSRLPSKSGCKGKKKYSLIPNENEKKERKKLSLNNSHNSIPTIPSAICLTGGQR